MRVFLRSQGIHPRTRKRRIISLGIHFLVNSMRRSGMCFFMVRPVVTGENGFGRKFPRASGQAYCGASWSGVWRQFETVNALLTGASVTETISQVEYLLINSSFSIFSPSCGSYRVTRKSLRQEHRSETRRDQI
jgi:hypothetical protein